MGSAAQIWPGPECLKTKPWPRVGESVVLKRFSEAHPLGFLPAMRREVGQVDEVVWIDDEGNVMVRSGWWWARTAIEPVITRGIALAHAKAKARMERFRAWLGRVDGISRGVARRHADKALSPEHAAEHAAADGFHWPFVATGWGDELRRDAVRPEWAALAFDLVRSPDWASLPWQQGPKEVGP